MKQACYTAPMKLLLVAGARPNFMKIASIVTALDAHNLSAKKRIDYLLVHTGQHYDEKMSQTFFRELDLPRPAVDLEVGSGTHAAQTAEIMKRFEPVLVKERPDAVLLVGDVNSTIACALVAAKIVLPGWDGRIRPHPPAHRSCRGGVAQPGPVDAGGNQPDIDRRPVGSAFRDGAERRS